MKTGWHCTDDTTGITLRTKELTKIEEKSSGINQEGGNEERNVTRWSGNGLQKMDQAMKRRKISSRNIDRHMKAKRTEDGKTQQISQLALIAMLMGTHTNNVKYRNCRKVFHGWHQQDHYWRDPGINQNYGKVVCRKIKRKEKINGKRKLRIKSQQISQLTFRKRKTAQEVKWLQTDEDRTALVPCSLA